MMGMERPVSYLLFLDGYVLCEEPCTDPYARFCGQTGAANAAPSDPIAKRTKNASELTALLDEAATAAEKKPHLCLNFIPCSIRSTMTFGVYHECYRTDPFQYAV